MLYFLQELRDFYKNYSAVLSPRMAHLLQELHLFYTRMVHFRQELHPFCKKCTAMFSIVAAYFLQELCLLTGNGILSVGIVLFLQETLCGQDVANMDSLSTTDFLYDFLL